MDPAFLDRLALSYGLYAVPAESGERGAAVFSQGAESDPRRRADEKIFRRTACAALPRRGGEIRRSGQKNMVLLAKIWYNHNRKQSVERTGGNGAPVRCLKGTGGRERKHARTAQRCERRSSMKVVIVGGVAGGATAAARIRRLDEYAEIVVFERTGYVSYANCGLPYYIGGVIADPAELTLQTPERFRARFGIDVRVRHEVTAIYPERKAVRVQNLDTGTVFEEHYDKLLLSPGAQPTQPELPGVEAERVFTLRTVEDTLRIRAFVEREKPRSAILAGGGFISLELAENLRELGVDVTIVQRPAQLLNPLDPEMASFIHAEMRRRGVRLMLVHSVTGFREEHGGVQVLLKGEPSLRADMVVLAIGVTPDTRLAREAGLALGRKGSIAVNERMETSAKDVYAVGDAVEIWHTVTGQKTLLSLAGPANKQGRIAADNICGGSSVYRGAQGSFVLKLFDLTAAATGINEQTAREAGIGCDKIYLSPSSHAGYYPGGQAMTIKVVFETGTFRLLGAQIVGREGVDKRIDVLAAAIRAGMTGPELSELDLAYAPPYSSAKDPVNMAGFMMENLAGGLLQQFHWDMIDTLPRDGSITLLDTRTAEEYGSGHARGFVNIPLDELRGRLTELCAGKPVYVMCQSGLRSYLACRMLAQRGFSCFNFSGGYRLYASVKEEQAAAEQTLPCGMNRTCV